MSEINVGVPTQITAHIKVVHYKKTYTFKEVQVSTDGVVGLPWGDLNPNECIGKFLPTVVEVQGPMAFTFETVSTPQKEASADASFLGFVFNLDEKTAKKLKHVILLHGTPPTPYARKFPRIPLERKNPSFPLYAVGIPDLTNKSTVLADHIVFEMINLSPNGLMMKTENPLAAPLGPGDKMQLILEPRGQNQTPISINAIIRRNFTEVSFDSKNFVYRYGVQFEGIGENYQKIFLGLLKDILTSLKSEMTP